MGAKAQITNQSWRIHAQATAGQLGLAQRLVVNDVQGIAHPQAFITVIASKIGLGEVIQCWKGQPPLDTMAFIHG